MDGIQNPISSPLEGKVAVARSGRRWCSDGFEMKHGADGRQNGYGTTTARARARQRGASALSVEDELTLRVQAASVRTAAPLSA